MREGQDSRRTQSITELVVIKDREKNLKFELEQTKEMLRHEKERIKHYMEEVRSSCLFLSLENVRHKPFVILSSSQT